MNKATVVLALVLTFAGLTRSQSHAELNVKYPVVKSFEVRPGVLLTPRFTADGEVCQMSFERQHSERSIRRILPSSITSWTDAIS